MEALGASVATHVTDACQVLVEHTAATGVEAALAKGRSADHKSAVANAEKVQGNTQRALDQALNLAAKRGEEVCTLREQPVTGRLNERVNVTPFFGVLLTTWCHCACLPSRFRKVAGTIHALRCG